MENFSNKTKLLIPDHQRFHSVKHIPLEMAQFYLAMGISEYWHCSQNDNPLSCSEYLEMLSDPISHLGFTFFMMASRKVTTLGLQSKITAPLASYLGLASGMLVQTVFEEIYRHPDMQDFLHSRYIPDPIERSERRNKAISSLYDKTFGDKKWYVEKIPLISSLLLAAGFSPLIVKSAYTINKAGYSLLKKVIGAEKFQKLDQFFNKQSKGLSRFKRRVSIKGIKVLTYKGKTTSLAPVIYLGEYLIGTITFLELHHIIDGYLSQYWSTYQGRSKLKDTLADVEKNLSQSIDETDEEFELSLTRKIDESKIDALKENIIKLENEWDNYRLALSEKSFSIYARQINSFDKMDKSTQKIFNYYGWIARGLDRSEDEWIKNEKDWHKPSFDLFSFDSTIQEELSQEENSNLNEMFCGRSIDEALEFKIDYSGIPIPFTKVTFSAYKTLRSKIGRKIKLTSYELHPYKIIDYPGTCEKDLKKRDGSPIHIINDKDIKNIDLQLSYICPIHMIEDSFVMEEKELKKKDCLEVQKKYRRFLISSAFNKQEVMTKIYEDFTEVLPDLLGLFKTQQIRRYEKSLQAKITQTLGENKNVNEFSAETKDSIIGSYQNELIYWNSLTNQYPQLAAMISPIIETTEKELQSALSLKDYISKNIETRDPSELTSENLFEEQTTWEGFWKGLIIQ